MIKARRAVAGIAAGAILALVPSVANATTQTIVTVDTTSSDGDIGASAQIGRTPLVGARYDIAGHNACVGVSYQVPVCHQIPIP